MAAIVSAANCTVTAGGGGASIVTKSGGTSGAFDASAISAAGLDGPFVLRVKPPGSGLCYVGVSANPTAGILPGSIDRSVQINAAVWRAADAGFLKPGSYPLDTFVWMRRAGGVLDYLSGPTLAGAVLRRTITDPGGTLFFDSVIATAGLTLEVTFDVPGAFASRRPRRVLTLALGF
jgi:hypothetical protein